MLKSLYVTGIYSYMVYTHMRMVVNLSAFMGTGARLHTILLGCRHGAKAPDHRPGGLQGPAEAQRSCRRSASPLCVRPWCVVITNSEEA